MLDEGRFGRLVRDEEFGHEVCRLLGDANERHRLTSDGFVRASQYDIVRSASMYEGVIEELVA